MFKVNITDKNLGLRRSIHELGIKLSKNEHFTYFLKKNAKLFLQVFLFLLVWLIVYMVSTYEATYLSTAKLIIRNSAITENYLISNRQNYMLTTSTGLRDPVLNTMQVIDSSLISEKLWKLFKQKYPEELKKLKIKNKAEWIKFNASPPKTWCRFLTIKNISSTDVINTSFTWTNPKVARDALAVVIKAFQEKNLELNKIESRKRSLYLDQEVKKIEREVAQVRQNKKDYKEKIKVANFPEKSRKITNIREEIAEKLSSTKSRIRGRKAEVARYEKVLGLTPSEAVDATALGQNKTYEKLRDQIYLEYGNLGLLKATYTDKSPKVKESRKRLEALEDKLEEEANKSISPRKTRKLPTRIADFARGTIVEKMTASYADIVFLQAKKAILSKYLAKLENELALMPEYERELDEMLEQENSLNKALDVLRRQQIEAHLKENETLSSLFVVDSPNLPDKANFPNMKHRLIIAFILAFMGAFFLMVVYNLIRFGGLHLIQFLNGKIKFYEENREAASITPDQGSGKVKISFLVDELSQGQELETLLEQFGPSKLIEIWRDSIGESRSFVELLKAEQTDTQTEEAK